MIQLVRTLIGTIAALGAYVFLSVVVGILFSNAILAQTIAVLGASATFLLILFDNKKRRRELCSRPSRASGKRSERLSRVPAVRNI